jgi:hypothetical protein
LHLERELEVPNGFRHFLFVYTGILKIERESSCDFNAILKNDIAAPKMRTKTLRSAYYVMKLRKSICKEQHDHDRRHQRASGVAGARLAQSRWLSFQPAHLVPRDPRWRD